MRAASRGWKPFGPGWAEVGFIDPGQLAPSCSIPPSPLEPVFVTKLAGNVARITWQPGVDGYYWQDVVRGGVVTLSVTGGDFAVATGGCLLNDSEEDWVDDPAIPPAGDGYWYLVRTEQHAGCPWPGPMMSYNTAYGGQTGDRDYEILNSTRDCECYPPYCGLCIPPYCHLVQPIR